MFEFYLLAQHFLQQMLRTLKAFPAEKSLNVPRTVDFLVFFHHVLAHFLNEFDGFPVPDLLEEKSLKLCVDELGRLFDHLLKDLCQELFDFGDSLSESCLIGIQKTIGIKNNQSLIVQTFKISKATQHEIFNCSEELIACLGILNTKIFKEFSPDKHLAPRNCHILSLVEVDELLNRLASNAEQIDRCGSRLHSRDDHLCGRC